MVFVGVLRLCVFLALSGVVYPNSIHSSTAHAGHKEKSHRRHLQSLALKREKHSKRHDIQSSSRSNWASQMFYSRLFDRGQHGRVPPNQRLPYHARGYSPRTAQEIQKNAYRSEQRQASNSALQGYPHLSSTVYSPTSESQPFPVWYEPVTEVNECVPPSCQPTKHVPWSPNRNETFSMKGKRFRSIGCWRDTFIRALPSLEGKHRLLMKGDYKNRANALMKCAEAALDKQLDLFALQDGGMCLGDKNASKSYKKYGLTNACEGDGEGGFWSNEVYSFLDNKGKPVVPVDGNYGQWSSWSACYPGCSTVNTPTSQQVRNRTCTSPLPANGGQGCSILGPGYESRVCQVPTCVGQATQPPASSVPTTPTTGQGSSTAKATTSSPGPTLAPTGPSGPTGSQGTTSQTPTTPPARTLGSTPTQPAPCKAKVNLGFLVDGSGSIESYGKGNFQKVKDFMKNMVRGFNVAKDGTHVGVVLYSTNPELVFGFDEHYDQASVLQEIDNVKYPGQRTNTGQGLAHARTELFAKGSRAGVPDMLFVLTDGISADSVDGPAQELRDLGVTVYSIGIGKNFDLPQLNVMATDPDSDHVLTADFDAMQTIVDKIRQSVCKKERTFVCVVAPYLEIAQDVVMGHEFGIAGPKFSPCAANVFIDAPGGPVSDRIHDVKRKKGIISPVALFPLNSKYITTEALHKDVIGLLKNVVPATGPDNKPGSALAFLGNGNSFLEFPRNPRLDTKKSLTLLTWVFPEKPGPIFNYRTNPWGTQLLLVKPNVLVGRITRRDGTLISQALTSKRVQPGEWNFVGLSYDHASGIAHLWINGKAADTKRVGLMDLGTNYPVRMGARVGGKRNLKGRVACMQVYDVALNKQQVIAAENACKKLQ